MGKAQLAGQLEVWREAGMDVHVPPAMRDVYALLAGDVDSVVPRLMCSMDEPSSSSSSSDGGGGGGLDWRRALGMHLWYGTPPGASVAEALEAYSAAVGDGEYVPPPCPHPSPSLRRSR